MRERFLAYRRSLPRAAPDPAVHETHARALYGAWFANRELAELFTPSRSDSLTGAAITAKMRREGCDWRPILRALSVPTLVFHGTEDALPTEVAEELAELLPQARLALNPRVGPHAVLGSTGHAVSPPSSRSSSPERRVPPLRSADVL